jgi:hypothetical protein
VRGVDHDRLVALDTRVDPDVSDVGRALSEEDEVAGLKRRVRRYGRPHVVLVLGGAGLEERGLLVRERDPGDRRTVYATLSSAGHEAFAAAQPAFLDAVERHFTSHIDQDTLAHLTELRARITAAAVGADQKTR